VTPQAVELLLQSLEEEAQLQKPKKKKPVNHQALIEPWSTAMASGLMTGKAFSPLTIAYYRAYVEEFLDKHTVLSLENFKKELMQIPPAAFAKRYKLYKAIVCFAKFLVREEQLDSSFLGEVKPLFPKRHTPSKRQTVDETGLKKLLNACKGPSDRLIVTLLSQTGLRVSEACALRLDDLDLDKGVLTVRMGKGGKARKVGLSTATIEAVKDYLSTRSELKPNDSLFLNKEGQPQTRHGLGRRLEKIGKSAGVKVSPHALRRAFVTINANKGRSLVMLQMACGHSDITTTRNYCLTTEQEVIEAMKGWD
jgi:integrase/recombinase XerD